MSAKRNMLLRMIALVLLVLMLSSIGANVVASEIDPRASDYLNSYSAYGYSAGLGKIQIWFSVTGVRYMDEIGALRIQLYESTDGDNWTWVNTYKYTSLPDMLGYDKVYHSGYIEYAGTIGRYYKAYVCIWAGTDGNGDTRYMWTQPVKATFFAD